MTTAISLFTRDLRVHDNPVLHHATRAANVVPLFVLDEAVLSGAFGSPNRVSFLLDSLADLNRSLESRGGRLVIRRGDPVAEVCQLVSETGAEEVHVARDVSGYAQKREDRLRRELSARHCVLHVHDAVITTQPPGAVVPSGNDHFAVFTPYFRRWCEQQTRAVLPAPDVLRVPEVQGRPLPGRRVLCDGEVSPRILRGGESEGRERMREWSAATVCEYVHAHDDLAADATSRLSPYLHFGCVSSTELVANAGPSEGEQAFVRQLAWRDFHHQVLAARPASSERDYRTRHDQWREDPEALHAWQRGLTGYPIVDAGMRQLQAEGWMHNRARLITASFLTKTLYLDWRLGAAHFLDLLVDGDIANNNLNWQWVAGTGTDTRPNRVLNPVRQAGRYDPGGDYVRFHVPELADLPTEQLLDPDRLQPAERRRRGYPAPIVDLAEARERFMSARGRG